MSDDGAFAAFWLYLISMAMMFTVMANIWSPTTIKAAIDMAEELCIPNTGLHSLKVESSNNVVEATCNNGVVATARYETGAQR